MSPPSFGRAKAIRLPITGEARNINGGEQVQDDKVIVLYAPAATVAALSGERGYGRLSFRLRDASPAAARSTAAAVRRYLATVPGFSGFTDVPELRAPGDWPGKQETEQFADFLSVITLLALLSALVLISNTMTTLVAEQTGEIGDHARRRRAAAAGGARVRAHGGAARRAGCRSGDRGRHRDLEPGGGLLRHGVLGQSTSASASMRPSSR